MELSNVIKKILRVINSLSHGLSKIDTHCHQGHQGSIFAYLGCQMSSAVVTLVVKQDLPRCLLGSLFVLVVTLLSLSSLGLNHGICRYCYFLKVINVVTWVVSDVILGSHKVVMGHNLGSSKCLHY